MPTETTSPAPLYPTIDPAFAVQFAKARRAEAVDLQDPYHYLLAVLSDGYWVFEGQESAFVGQLRDVNGFDVTKLAGAVACARAAVEEAMLAMRGVCPTFPAISARSWVAFRSSVKAVLRMFWDACQARGIDPYTGTYAAKTA